MKYTLLALLLMTGTASFATAAQAGELTTDTQVERVHQESVDRTQTDEDGNVTSHQSSQMSHESSTNNDLNTSAGAETTIEHEYVPTGAVNRTEIRKTETGRVVRKEE